MGWAQDCRGWEGLLCSPSISLQQSHQVGFEYLQKRPPPLVSRCSVLCDQEWTKWGSLRSLSASCLGKGKLARPDQSVGGKGKKKWSWVEMYLWGEVRGRNTEAIPAHRDGITKARVHPGQHFQDMKLATISVGAQGGGDVGWGEWGGQTAAGGRRAGWWALSAGPRLHPEKPSQDMAPSPIPSQPKPQHRTDCGQAESRSAGPPSEWF